MPWISGLGNVHRQLEIFVIDPSHKSHNAWNKYPTMHHFVTEMCIHVHISVTQWCIVGYETGALWDFYTPPPVGYCLPTIRENGMRCLTVKSFSISWVNPCVYCTGPWTIITTVIIGYTSWISLFDGHSLGCLCFSGMAIREPPCGPTRGANAGPLCDVGERLPWSEIQLPTTAFLIVTYIPWCH